jgi:hypothetical protein
MNTNKKGCPGFRDSLFCKTAFKYYFFVNLMFEIPFAVCV